MSAPVEPGSGRWNGLVTEAIRRDASRAWWLGDAALEIAPMGEPGASTGCSARLRQFAEQIEIPFETITTYRQVASNWPSSRRLLDTSWSAHQALASPKHQHLLEAGMSAAEARAAAGQRPSHAPPAAPTPADKAAQVAALLQDPEVAERARGAVTKAAISTPKAARETYRAAQEKLVASSREGRNLPPLPPKPGTREERQKARLDAYVEMREVVRDVIGRITVILDPAGLDPVSQRLEFVAENLDGVAESDRQELARCLKALSARASEWEDRVLGISGSMIGN